MPFVRFRLLRQCSTFLLSQLFIVSLQILPHLLFFRVLPWCRNFTLSLFFQFIALLLAGSLFFLIPCFLHSPSISFLLIFAIFLSLSLSLSLSLCLFLSLYLSLFISRPLFALNYIFAGSLQARAEPFAPAPFLLEFLTSAKHSPRELFLLNSALGELSFSRSATSLIMHSAITADTRGLAR